VHRGGVLCILFIDKLAPQPDTGSNPVVLKLWYARAFQVVREQLSCHIRKALVIRFCVKFRSCVMLMLLIRLCAILNLSTFEQITFF